MGVDHYAAGLPIRGGLTAMATDTGTGSIAIVSCGTVLAVVSGRDAQVKLAIVGRSDMTDTTVIIN